MEDSAKCVAWQFIQLKTCLDVDVVVVDNIRRPISAGLVSWKELSFTEDDLTQEEQKARVRSVDWQLHRNTA